MKLFAAAAMLAACTTASAQFSNAKGGSSESSASGWSTVWVQYNPTTVSADGGGSSSATGFSAGYSRAFSVSKSIPLYVEGGAGLQYTWASEDGVDTKWLSVKIPVDVTYKFQIPNSSIAILPYAGLNFRVNVWGEGDNSVDLFDKDKMGDDFVWNRFQVGWRAGAKAHFGNSFMVGVGYGHDFSELSKGVKLGEWSLQLGYMF